MQMQIQMQMRLRMQEEFLNVQLEESWKSLEMPGQSMDSWEVEIFESSLKANS